MADSAYHREAGHKRMSRPRLRQHVIAMDRTRCKVPMGHPERNGAAVASTMDHQAEDTRLAAIVEASDDAIIAKDLNSVILSWNRTAERLFGYPAAEVLGQPITIIFPPDRIEEEAVFLARVRRG
jgi:PAS domain-containing protein